LKHENQETPTREIGTTAAHRAKQRPALTQYSGYLRFADGLADARTLPQDAHSRCRFTREVLFSRPAISVSRARYPKLAGWGHSFAGQCVPEGARLTALQGAHVLFIPPPRLASCREGRVRSGPARCLAHDPARARHCNGVYVLSSTRGFETGNIRGNSAPLPGTGILGRARFCDPFGPASGRGFAWPRRDSVWRRGHESLEDIRRNCPSP